MKNFTWYNPTEVVFGKDAHNETAALVKKHGGSRVLLVYGGGSVERSGLLARITGLLEGTGIACETYGGIKPNPRAAEVREGIRKAVDFGADFVLAVGGGSVIDAAKAIAVGAANPDADFWDYWEGGVVPLRSTPVGSVLTISAAGSETSNVTVITGDNGHKRSFRSDIHIPRFAVMNPELTYTVPKYQIACGVTDIILHTIERYFTAHADGNELTDAFAAALLRTVIKNGRAAMNDPSDYDAMSELMWCGSLSHNGLTGLGRPLDFSAHQLGHELSGRFDVSHGASLSSGWGSWALYVYKTNPARFAKFAADVWDLEADDTEAAALSGIERTVDYFRSLGMPTCLTELGVDVLPDEVIDEMAESAVFFGKRLVGNFRPLDKRDIIEIYNMANR